MSQRSQTPLVPPAALRVHVPNRGDNAAEVQTDGQAISPNRSSFLNNLGFGRLRALGGGRTDTAAAADQGQNQSTQANQNPLRTRGAGRQTAAGSAGFPAITTAAGGPVRAANPGPAHRIRLVPHLEASRSLRFDPASRDLQENGDGVRLGRFNDRRNPDNASQVARTGGGGGTLDMSEIAFRSKVVSRGHAELWVEDNGQFFLRDTSSSSGTFLNHIRLSPPNVLSRPFPIKEGDVIQLGVDFQGGQEEIYRCVKMRVELGASREWQRTKNEFNTNAMKQLKALGGNATSSPSSSKKASITDCCICLFSVSILQSLFIAPCSHVFHYKCIRPLLQQHHPSFCCPLCRAFSDLEADVEHDDIGSIVSRRMSGASGTKRKPPFPEMTPTQVAEGDSDSNAEMPHPEGESPSIDTSRDNTADATQIMQDSAAPELDFEMAASPEVPVIDLPADQDSGRAAATSGLPMRDTDDTPHDGVARRESIDIPHGNLSPISRSAGMDTITPRNETFLSTLADSYPNDAPDEDADADAVGAANRFDEGDGEEMMTPVMGVSSVLMARQRSLDEDSSAAEPSAAADRKND